MLNTFLNKPRVMQLREGRDAVFWVFFLTWMVSAVTWIDNEWLPRFARMMLGWSNSSIGITPFDRAFGSVMYNISDAFLFAYFGVWLVILFYRLTHGWVQTSKAEAEKQYGAILHQRYYRVHEKLLEEMDHRYGRSGWQPLHIEPLDRNDLC